MLSSYGFTPLPWGLESPWKKYISLTLVCQKYGIDLMPPIANIGSLQECLYGDFNRTLVDKYCTVAPTQQSFYPLPPKKNENFLAKHMLVCLSCLCDMILSFQTKIGKCHCSKKLLRNMWTFRIHKVTPFQHWRSNFYVKLNIKWLYVKLICFLQEH